MSLRDTDVCGNIDCMEREFSVIKCKAFRGGAILSCLVALFSFVTVHAEEAERGAKDLVLFRNAAEISLGNIEAVGGISGRLLNDASDGRKVVVATLDAGQSIALPGNREHTIELLVLDGELVWSGQSLRYLDYGYSPYKDGPIVWLGGNHGATLLLFLDPPRDSDSPFRRIQLNASKAWLPATVALRDAGIALALETKDLLYHPPSGQRTWLLRVDPDFSIPWEVHTSAEEGFLIAGDFKVGECLPEGAVVGNYTPGGYFYRPAGRVHSGPSSGSRRGALWLLRTPSELTVEFWDSCEG